MLPGPLSSLAWHFSASTTLGLSVKGPASVEGPPVVAHAQIIAEQFPAAGQLLHCSRDCFAGHWDLEVDG